LWITKAKNGSLFASAFKQHQNVYLLFSINKSKAFQGYVSVSLSLSLSLHPCTLQHIHAISQATHDIST
jgi:hypothetical protein